MVLTVTLNPAIDKILIVDKFEIHKLHRLKKGEKSMVSAGGKGVNIAQVLSKMGDKVIATGFAGCHAGHMLCDALRIADVTTNFIFTPNPTRTNISIFDRTNKTLTEINDFGQKISASDIAFFIENYERLLSRVELIVIAGSLPLGVSPDIYIKLTELARAKGKKVLIHTAPNFLENIIEAQPFLINPDMRSEHQLFGKPVDGVDQFITIGLQILKRSPKTELVVFTHRIENVVAITREKSYVLRPIQLNIANMLGYGDAYLAGFIHSFSNNDTLKENLHYASAAGLTDVEEMYKEISDVSKIQENLKRIDIEEIN